MRTFKRIENLSEWRGSKVHDECFEIFLEFDFSSRFNRYAGTRIRYTVVSRVRSRRFGGEASFDVLLERI